MGLGRVLVVDDEADIRKVLRLTLIKAGYDVVEAEDGEKGVVIIQKSGIEIIRHNQRTSSRSR